MFITTATSTSLPPTRPFSRRDVYAHISWVSISLQSRYTSWRRLGGERVYSSYSFMNSALDGGGWSESRPGRVLSPGEDSPGTHWTGGWVGPRAGLGTEVRGKILYLYRGSNLDRPVV
jgi:hypothetical protein